MSLSLPDATKNQKIEYNQADNQIEWKIEGFKGADQHSFVAVINLKEQLNSYQIRKNIGPIKLSFEINNYMSSAILVRYLRAEGQFDP